MTKCSYSRWSLAQVSEEMCPRVKNVIFMLKLIFLPKYATLNCFSWFIEACCRINRPLCYVIFCCLFRTETLPEPMLTYLQSPKSISRAEWYYNTFNGSIFYAVENPVTYQILWPIPLSYWITFMYLWTNSFGGQNTTWSIKPGSFFSLYLKLPCAVFRLVDVHGRSKYTDSNV